MKKTYTIHDLPSTERPRERVREVGVDNLSLQELLALVIERGRLGLNVLSIAQDPLAEFGSLKKNKTSFSKRVAGSGRYWVCYGL